MHRCLEGVIGAPSRLIEEGSRKKSATRLKQGLPSGKITLEVWEGRAVNARTRTGGMRALVSFPAANARTSVGWVNEVSYTIRSALLSDQSPATLVADNGQGLMTPTPLEQLGLAFFTTGFHMYQARWCLQKERRLRFTHRDHSTVQKNGGDTHGVRARHGRRMLWLHDDEPERGLIVFRRGQQVEVLEDTAPRFIQNEPAQPLILFNPAGFLPDGITRRWSHAADNDVSNLAFGMTRHDLYDRRRFHLGHGLAIWRSARAA